MKPDNRIRLKREGRLGEAALFERKQARAARAMKVRAAMLEAAKHKAAKHKAARIAVQLRRYQVKSKLRN